MLYSKVTTVTSPWWSGLRVSMTHRAMLAGVFGSWWDHPMPNRSKDRDQTKCGPLVLQVGGWAEG